MARCHFVDFARIGHCYIALLANLFSFNERVVVQPASLSNFYIPRSLVVIATNEGKADPVFCPDIIEFVAEKKKIWIEIACLRQECKNKNGREHIGKRFVTPNH